SIPPSWSSIQRVNMRTVVFLLFSLTAAAVFAEDVGYLYLHRHAEIAERDGAQAADLFVYTADGAPVASARGGQFPGGELVPLPPGDYFVEVGRFRAPVGAVRMRVEEGQVTVVPSGWVT